MKEIPNLVNPRGPGKLWLCPQRSASRGTEEDEEGVWSGGSRKERVGVGQNIPRLVAFW